MIPQILKRQFAKAAGVDDKKNDNGYNNNTQLVVNEQDANLITSICDDGMHALTIDLDVPAVLVPSAQPGHSHLFIEKKMTWEVYSKLLYALAAAGIIEQGYYKASSNRGYSSVRIPGEQIKQVPELNPTYLDRVKEMAKAKWDAWMANTVIEELVNHKEGDELSPLAKKYILASYKSDNNESAQEILALVSEKIPDIIKQEAEDLGELLENLGQLSKALAGLEEPKAIPVMAPEEMFIAPAVFQVDPELEALLDEQAALLHEEDEEFQVEVNPFNQELLIEDNGMDALIAQVQIDLDEEMNAAWIEYEAENNF